MATPVLIPNTEVKHGSGDDTLMGKVASRQNQIFNRKNMALFVCGFTKGRFDCFLRKLYNDTQMFNNKKLYLIIFAVFIVLAVAGISATPMENGFFHKFPNGGCVSLVAKNLPCPKYGFYLGILTNLFLLLAISLFLIIIKPFFLTPFFLESRRFFDHHSFLYKIKTNRWLALFAFV